MKMKTHAFTTNVTILGCIILSSVSVASGTTNEKTKINSSCDTKPCSCCLESVNCHTKTDSCNDNCKDGFFGAKCKTNCPTKCVRCNEVTGLSYTGNCTECKAGFYSTEAYYQCQFNCSSQCQTCTSASVCTSCKTGYVLHNGQCSVCKTGCASCTQYNNCTKCQNGYFNSGGVTGNLHCVACSTGCASCISHNDCTECQNGYYDSGGVTGKLNCVACSTGCFNQCDKTAGSCICKPGFDGDKCDQCAPNVLLFPNCSTCVAGFFGTSCDQTCPKNCEESACLRQSGICAKGCVEGFAGGNCNECFAGKFGPNCFKICPENCEGTCNRTSGYCHKCKTSFSGNKCDSCITRKYGKECSLICPSGCKDSCDRETGTCHSCIEGRYGNTCQNSCSEHCVNGTCRLETGACDNGCMAGYSGDQCCMRGSNCKKCSLSMNCITCEDGFYGNNCSVNCSTNCDVCGRDNGTCISCISGYKGESCEEHMPITDDIGFPVPLVVGVVATGVSIIIIICCIVILRRRSSYKAHLTDSNQLTVSFSTEGELENENDIHTDDDSNKEPSVALPDGTVYAVARKTKRKALNELPTVDSTSDTDQQGNIAAAVNSDYYNTYYDGNRGIAVNDLTSFVERANERFLNEEFQKLPKGLIKPTDEAEKLHNLKKNRYNAMYPYDDNRVVLDGPGSDFINASYIEGFRKRREYIASFGPVAKATEGFNTFWRMVWQEKTEKIVMVTNLRENGGMKCEKYWPDVNVTTLYGDVSVTGHTQDVYAEYTVRSFTVKKGKEERSLHHIHYTAWPDKGVPDDVTSMIEFRSKVNATKVKLGGPIIVHCSAGVGRTGTYIALDILTLQGNRTGCVDIFDCVEKLRQQRTIMVQTLGQYEYVYRALVHSLTLGSEAIPAEKFRSYLSSLSGDDMKIKFEKLTHLKEKISTEEHEAITRNMALKRMSRVGADIPGDNNRPRLYVGRTAEESSFINAVFVNSFKVKKQFVVTQTPLPTTVDDFLTLVLQEKCSCIVSMDPVGLTDKTIGIYMPADNQVLRTELFEVRSAKVETNPSYTLRTLDITAHFKQTSTTHTVKHFQCSHWPEMSKTPKSTDHFLQLVNEVQSTAEASPGHSPVMVHCLTGSERSGLLCVVMSLIQKMEIEHEVSVINTVRQVKLRRPRAIPDMDQFSFCHHCVSQYLEAFDTYSNFS